MKSFIPHGSLLPKAYGILFACALMFAPEPTFAQHGGGGGHAGGHFGGGHFSGGGSHSAPPLVGFGTHNMGIVGKRAVVVGNRAVTSEQIFSPKRFPRLPGFGFAGPFFGGYDSWGSACGPFWIWGFACDKVPYFGFGYSNYSSTAKPNSAEAVLWLKGGTVYGLRDYWFVAGKLHYVINYGGENSIAMDRVDLQKTVDEDALRGVDFTLTGISD
ncbi:MAG: hypothetical protein WB621_24605 [Candidatus Acidiferrales bacterium]